MGCCSSTEDDKKGKGDFTDLHEEADKKARGGDQEPQVCDRDGREGGWGRRILGKPCFSIMEPRIKMSHVLLLLPSNHLDASTHAT